MMQNIIASTTQTPADDAESEYNFSQEIELRGGSISLVEHGQRLDKFLVAAAPELSRGFVQQLIEQGAAQINGQIASKAAYKLKVGDVWRFELRPSAQAQAFQPENLPIETVYLDEHIRVVHKAAGMVVHPAAGNWSGTLLNGLLALDAQAAGLPRAGIVHRLDKDTSGLMVLARTRAAMDKLIAQIAAREVKREYLALAHGDWGDNDDREVEAAIGRDTRNRVRMAVVELERGEHGKPAHTSFFVLDGNADATFLHCKLHTGRTHQIRVHAAHIHHPLVADAVYGGRPLFGLERQGLHAWQLGFEHPIIPGKQVHCTAPLPPDMAAAVQAAGFDLP
jgi:23S rRNA pseudouridine1911/1915/1917 synthase